MENTLYYTTEKPGNFVRPISIENTAVLVVDMQNEFVLTNYGDAKRFKAENMYQQWEPYYNRLWHKVVPTIQKLLAYFRNKDTVITYARIACFRSDGTDRSPVQRRPGWNNILLPRSGYGAQIISELSPKENEIVIEKTNDSVANGTGYVQILRNLNITTVVVSGIVTDQCVATSVRDLADLGFNVIVIEDACAAATKEAHDAELKIMNHIYCEVMNSQDVQKLYHSLELSRSVNHLNQK